MPSTLLMPFLKSVDLPSYAHPCQALFQFRVNLHSACLLSQIFAPRYRSCTWPSPYSVQLLLSEPIINNWLGPGRDFRTDRMNRNTWRIGKIWSKDCSKLKRSWACISRWCCSRISRTGNAYDTVQRYAFSYCAIVSKSDMQHEDIGGKIPSMLDKCGSIR